MVREKPAGGVLSADVTTVDPRGTADDTEVWWRHTAAADHLQAVSKLLLHDAASQRTSAAAAVELHPVYYVLPFRRILDFEDFFPAVTEGHSLMWPYVRPLRAGCELLIPVI